MAQLTWRNVEPPAFAGATDSLRLMGQMLNSGVANLDNALADFQTNRQAAADRENTSAIGAAALGYTDAASLDQALKAGTIWQNRQMTPEMINFLAGRRNQLLKDENQSLVNTGQGILNSQRAEDLGQSQWTNANTRSYEANRPAAIQAANEIRMYAEQGTPEGMAIAKSLLQKHGDTFAKAGWSPNQVLGFGADNMTAADTGMRLNDAFVKAQDAKDSRSRGQAADELFAAAMTGINDKEEASTRIRSLEGLNPSVKTAVLERIDKEGDALLGPAADPNRVLVNQMLDQASAQGGAAPRGNRLIQYANQGATRNLPLSNELTSAITPVLNDLGVGMKVFSGGQHSNKPGEGTGSTRHNDGHSGDVEFYSLTDGHKLDPRNPADVPLLQEIVRRGKANGITGWGEGADYMGSGRVHLGFGNPAVWGAGGKGANAPQWLREAYEGAPAGRSPMPPASAANAIAAAGQPPVIQTPTTPAATTTASGQTPLGFEATQTMLNQASELASRGQSLVDTAAIDSSFNALEPLVNELSTRPNKGLGTAGDVANQIHKDLGDNDEGGILASNGLTAPIIAEEVQRLVREYDLAPDVAGAFLKSGITRNHNWFSKDTRQIDTDLVDGYMSQFIDPKTGRVSVSRALEQMQASRAKSQASQTVQALMSQVQEAQQAYLNAVKRSRERGDNRGVAEAQQRFNAIYMLAQAQINRIDKEGLIRANTNSRTGR